MKRTTNKSKVQAILTADWHLRDDQPKCRVDDFMQAQRDFLTWIQEVQAAYGNCPIFHAGDMFHNWKASPELITFAINALPPNIYTIIGNHDLPQHNLKNYHKSALRTLEEAKAVKLCTGHLHWGQDKNIAQVPKVDILMAHVMVWHGEKPWHDCDDCSAVEFMKLNGNVTTFLTGHNHKTFHVLYGHQQLLNPGNPLVQNAVEVDDPSVIGLWREDGTIDLMRIPSFGQQIDTSYLEEAKEKKSRYEAFINRVKLVENPELNFVHNMNQYLAANKIDPEVRVMLQSCIGE